MIVPDLFFATRIASVASQIGVHVLSPAMDSALEAIATSSPSLVIVDLTVGEQALALIRSLKAAPATRAIPIVGFYPHVDQPLRSAAEAAGADRVLPRSAFSARLPAILAGSDLSPRGPDC